MSTPHVDAVRALLRTLSTTWPRSFGQTLEDKQAVLAAWASALAGVPASVLPEVGQRLMQASRYAPKPAEALAMARTLAPTPTRTVGYSPAPTLEESPDLRCILPTCQCGPLVVARAYPGAPARYFHRHELGAQAEILARDWRSPVGTPSAEAAA